MCSIQNTEKAAEISPCRLSLKLKLFCFREVVLAYSAKRTLKVFGKILKLCAGLDAVIRIAELLIIFPSAYVAYVFHILPPTLCIKGPRRAPCKHALQAPD